MSQQCFEVNIVVEQPPGVGRDIYPFGNQSADGGHATFLPQQYGPHQPPSLKYSAYGWISPARNSHRRGRLQ